MGSQPKRLHKECTKVGVSVPRDMKVDECMGSFGCIGRKGVHWFVWACWSMKGCDTPKGCDDS
jgi:hypothetical protein